MIFLWIYLAGFVFFLFIPWGEDPWPAVLTLALLWPFWFPLVVIIVTTYVCGKLYKRWA